MAVDDRRTLVLGVLGCLVAVFIGLGVGGILWWQAYVTVRELPELHGLTEAQLLDRLGSPTDRGEFPMSDCCDEMRISLYNTYPPDDPATRAVSIRELTWDHDSHHTVVWLHRVDDRWVVLDTLRYPDGTSF